MTVDGDPLTMSIGTNITKLTCDQLLGDWEVGIELELFQRGWTPTFDGEWWAVPEPEGPEESELKALIEDFPELLTDADELRTDLRAGAFQEAPNATGTRLLELAERAGEIANRLHNLSECDKQAIGSETLQKWSTMLAGTVAEVIIAVFGSDIQYADYSAVNALIRAADQSGAYGSGSSLDPAIQVAVESSLIALTSQSVEDNLNLAQDESWSLEKREDFYLWALGAAMDAAGHGWTITVNGQSYPPGTTGPLFETSPSQEAEESG
jgi:hypothetical protein